MALILQVPSGSVGTTEHRPELGRQGHVIPPDGDYKWVMMSDYKVDTEYIVSTNVNPNRTRTNQARYGGVKPTDQ